MLNFCVDGMCFLSDKYIESNNDIFIKMVQPVSEIADFGDFTFFRAKSIWCRKLNRNKKGLNFETGVQYLAKCTPQNSKVYHCALCGDPIDPEEFMQLENYIYMQKECFSQYCDLPNGELKKGLKEFMIGNVI
jgi:hypothetical protein